MGHEENVEVVRVVESIRKMSDGDLWCVLMNANIEMKKRLEKTGIKER